MAVWELIRDAMRSAHDRGHEWLILGEVAKEVLSREPGTNRGSIAADTKFHCINDPSKKHSPGLRYRVNPLLITDAPRAHGKRYRLLTEEERRSFLANVRDDLDLVSYAQTLEWLANPSRGLEAVDAEVEEEEDLAAEAIGGVALLELHLQDYIFRHWKSAFPELELYNGAQGREFRTQDPSVGIIDFLCVDKSGNFVVIETKRDMPDRRAIGQILSYMGWVKAKLCAGSQDVRGILLTGSVSDELKLASSVAAGLKLYTYEISFAIQER